MAAPRKPRTTDQQETPQTSPSRTLEFLDTQIHDPITALEVADALIRDGLDPNVKTSLEQAYRGSLALLNLAKIANEGRQGGWLLQRTPPERPRPTITVVTNVPEPMTPEAWANLHGGSYEQTEDTHQAPEAPQR